MNFPYEYLAPHGVVLVPPSAQDYDRHLADLQCRANASVEGSPPLLERLRPRIIPEERPTSAILLNLSPKSIVGLHVVWRFETETSRTFRHSQGMLSPKGWLLSFFHQNESITKLYAYWQTIFSRL